ncbi:hypothetical protein ACFH04_00870 [Streptomyces noboritoensis]|uniref:Uncharacterized protein n=1 Tax=Streptomyces noboritoensis TaxID=67337 RepID=A0ABV6T922_9ACTN
MWRRLVTVSTRSCLASRFNTRSASSSCSRSCFSCPHCSHDAKANPLVRDSPLSTTRADRLGRSLRELLAREPLFEGFEEMEERAVRLDRGGFL